MTRAAVLLTGAIAIALVARAASIYRGADPLAFALVLLIGVGLCLGIAELLIRAGQAARLEREIATLPAEATIEAVDAAGPQLRGLLRARITGVSGTMTTAPFTPYLLGLLVMIGMLGTFLGLFETLRGAREALITSSGDVDALRTGLAAPMVGLSRAFGCSAAGVSASAMLGLGAVFVRRAEAATVSALARYAAGPLARLTTAGRQLVALEALALQGQALPEAAAALRETAARLEKLEAHLLDGQMRSAAEAAAAIRAVASEVRGDLAAGIERAAKATTAAVGPLLTGAVERAGATAGEALSSFTGRIEGRLTEEANVRREREKEHLTAMESAIEAQATAQLDALQTRTAAQIEALQSRTSTQAEALHAHLAKQADALEAQMEAQIAAQMAALQSRTQEHAEAVRAQVGAQMEALRSHAEAHAESLRARTEAQTAAVEGQLAVSATTLAATSEALSRREAARADALALKLDALVTAVAGGLERLGASEQARAVELSDRLENVGIAVASAVTQSAAADAERLRSLNEAVAEASAQLGAAMTAAATQGAAFTSRVEQTAAVLANLEAQQATRLDERAERLFTAMSAEATRFEEAQAARARAADARVGELDSILAEHLRALGSALTGPIAEVVRAAQAAPEAAAKVVDAARERLDARAEADAARDVRLDALTEKLDFAATRIGDMSGTQAAQLTELTERTRTVLDAQASQLAAFELRLEGARTASAEAMAEQLGGHARGIGESLAATAALVQDASSVLRAGGAEMSSVAEMFTGAVDSYRAASDRWLENLGAIEDAIARKEGGEAADLLGAYLDQTREVFDHSLRFQRELFSELRALRSKASS